VSGSMAGTDPAGNTNAKDQPMWTCVKCGSKIDPVFDVCWNCGTSREGVEDPNFVTADEAGPIDDPRYDPVAVPDEPVKQKWTEVVGAAGEELVSCYQAFSLMESKFIADQLNEQGIPAMSDTIDLQDALGTMQGNPRVYVRSVDYPRARMWLLRYDAHKRTEPERHLEP
jgi:hypothetical protein